MNRLQHETSPYLLQHAGNPVDWYPWGPEALARAREEDKPILVSIGYSTCHWCHVMERESFEDANVAAFMNAHFINIKVDREERPDLDHIYMDACQAINGSGGWPLNCFLLPDGRPYFAGTYYPPRPAHNRPAWSQVLQRMHRVWTEERQTVLDQAGRLADAIRNSGSVFLADELRTAPAEQVFNPVVLQNLTYHLLERADEKHGGFGGAPKFPQTMALDYLLDYHYYTGDEAALAQVERSATAMIRGGIFDQIGGGFARYATDRAWLVPHFEKMLYDNGLLLGLLAKLYRRTEKPLYREAIEATVTWLEREMVSPEGTFYAALDADSEGEEGKFYVWSLTEIREVLGEDAELFARFYDVSHEGNWEGHNILWRPQSIEDFATATELPPDELQDRLDRAAAQLLAHREQRVRPGRDEKILLNWNALMISGLAQAGLALEREDYLSRAESCLAALLDRLAEGPELYHNYKDGKVGSPAFLDDYAYTIAALLDIYPLRFATEHLDRAQELLDYVREHFRPDAESLFYFARASDDLPLRRAELYDNAVPAGNSVMVHNLLRLAEFTGNSTYREEAEALVRPLIQALERYGSTFSNWSRALLYLVYPGNEVAVTGPDARQWARELAAELRPNTPIMAAEQPSEGNYPLLADRFAADKNRIFICKNFACNLPVDNLAEARSQLSPRQS
jgi:uncharacterized protein YyaL (SSP411 family)